MLESIKYANAENTTISATENGVPLSIPIAPGNRHYDEIVEQGLIVADYAAPPATWDSVRGERNQLLKDTDWQAGTDVTMSDAQTAYRKKLRDLPATNSDPTKIVFPDAP